MLAMTDAMSMLLKHSTYNRRSIALAGGPSRKGETASVVSCKLEIQQTMQEQLCVLHRQSGDSSGATDPEPEHAASAGGVAGLAV